MGAALASGGIQSGAHIPPHVLWVLESDLCPAGYTQGHPSLTGNQGVGIGPQVMFRFIVPFHN